LQPADLFAHHVCQRIIARAKADYHGLGVFAEQREQPLFDPLFHVGCELVATRKIQTPTSGSADTATHTAGNPKWSTMDPIAGETNACISPYPDVSAATLKAARPGPNKSIGRAYMLVELHKVQKKLAQIRAVASAGVGISGIAAVAASA